MILKHFLISTARFVGWIIKSFQKANDLVLGVLKQNVYQVVHRLSLTGGTNRIIDFLLLLRFVGIVTPNGEKYNMTRLHTLTVIGF